MSNFHISPIQDTGGNINFIPSTSNNTDKSLLSIYWTDIIDKPNFSNISTTGIYNDLNKNKPWIYSSSNSYNSPITSFIGIGTNNPNFNLDINGSINLTGILNKNKSPYQNSQWVSIIENSSSNIYFNDGSIGIGTSTFTSNFNLNGNLRTAGNIYPDTTLSYNLGSSDFKWRHLYLSSNSIYLDNISISKTTDNYISIPSVNLNDITISSNFNGNNKTGNLRLNQISVVVIDDSNNLNKYPVLFDNPYDYSNIILSNVLSNSSNNIYTKLKSLNTDTIPIPNDTNKRFIVNDTYNRDITFTGILTTSNLITSNINVIGDTTTLNTTLYMTEQLQVENNTNATAVIVKQINATKNLFECYNQSSLSFIINSNGNIGIGGGANNTYKLNINGSLNTSDEIYIKGTNITNIIDLKVSNTSNTLINYNNLINRPLLSSVALNGIYGSLIGTPFIASGNNYYTSLSGNLGIGTSIINNKLEVLGEINVGGASGEVLIKGTNISNIIDLKVSNTSNILVNYNNFINRPPLKTVATTGNYNDLINKPVYISDYKQMSNIPFRFNTGNNNLIYNTNSGNFGIKTANPNYKFQVNGDLNYTSSLRISNVIVPFSYYSNTNITSSNGIFSYISNNNSFGYYTFLTSGSITFPQATNCDLLVVAAGGNGGMSSGSGGGGAGEVIYYPNYPFSAGTSNITIGYSDSNTNNRISRILFNGSSIITALGGGDGGMSNASITTNPSSGGSGGGGRTSQNGAAAGTKWNATYSYSTAGANGTASVGGNGGSATAGGGFTESITGSSLVVGVGGSGASSSSLPVLKTTYGSGGDGNGGLGTQGIVIIKVPLNISSLKYDGNFEYSNIFNRPLINDVFTNSNLINLTINNQINFPLGDASWANEWFLYMGMSPTNISNSFIFWHLNSNSRVNSKWWFNGTTANTNNEISDIRVKKEIIDIINPLSNLMLIKPKEYYLCDEKDYLKKYGIIAQNVKEVLPEFVYMDSDYIANIYTYCNYLELNNSYFLNISNGSNNCNFTFNSSNIQVGDELKLLLNNNENNKEIIIEDLPYHNRYKRRFAVVKEIIDEKTIEITQKLELEETEKTNLFIYGKKVNDFLKLDYSSLYTLNIKCNQELYKTYLEQQEKLISLNQRLINLENFN